MGGKAILGYRRLRPEVQHTLALLYLGYPVHVVQDQRAARRPRGQPPLGDAAARQGPRRRDETGALLLGTSLRGIPTRMGRPGSARPQSRSGQRPSSRGGFEGIVAKLKESGWDSRLSLEGLSPYAPAPNPFISARRSLRLD